MMFLFDRHRRFRDQLSAYIDGGLDLAAAGRLEAHLEECARCRAELEQLRSTVAALRELPEAQVPRSFTLSPERAAVRRPSMPAAPLAFGARIAAAGVAAALAVVLVVDLGDLGGDGGGPGVAPDGMLAERQADGGKANGEGAAGEEPAATGMMHDEWTDEGGLAAEGDAGAGVAPEPEDGALRESTGAPSPSPGQRLPPDTTAVPAGAPRPRGLTPEPEAGIQEAVPPPSEDGGIDALTVAEIGLAAALGVLVSGSLVLAFARRKR